MDCIRWGFKFILHHRNKTKKINYIANSLVKTTQLQPHSQVCLNNKTNVLPKVRGHSLESMYSTHLENTLNPLTGEKVSFRNEIHAQGRNPWQKL